jgi:threonine dehydrogenase-like Zn-dependent dehydrogenase
VLALVYDGSLKIMDDHPLPQNTGEALVRVRLAGICNTDLEITRGYAGFRGILGHEFVGEVRASATPTLIGKRVVGEINASCGLCTSCLAGMPTHCADRTVLGIHARSGAFAEYVSLPSQNLHVVPDNVADEEAVFTEPLAAALEILQQVHVRPSERVIVLGDGKLGSLAAQVLRLVGCDLLVVGKHADKLATLEAMGIATALVDNIGAERADVVVECTGNPSGLEAARTLLHPRGRLILKSTFHGAAPVALSPFVVDEITIVGSRCGPFEAALRLLQNKLVHAPPMITATYALADGVQAMSKAAQPGVMKVLLRM